MPDPDTLLLIIGNARSGSTLLGALLDSHQAVTMGFESEASKALWRGYTRKQLLESIVNSNKAFYRNARQWEGYRYDFASTAQTGETRVLGDKIWNPATLLLHGDPGLLPRLESIVGTPVRLLNATRNPLDTIATMCHRSGATRKDRIHWFFAHCESLQALLDSQGDRIRSQSLEAMIQEPDTAIPELFAWLGLQTSPDFLTSCRRGLFEAPKLTRNAVPWLPEELLYIRQRCQDFEFLQDYGEQCDAAEMGVPQA